jgi:outer membrane protein assembly factor BamB
VLTICTTGTRRATAIALLLAWLLPAAPAAGQAPQSAHRFPTTPRAAVALDAEPFGPPAIGDGRIYVAFAAGQLAAHRLSDGAELWRIDLAMEHPPVASDDRVLAVAGGAIQARHAADGREVWRFETPALAVPLLAHEGWIILAPAGRLTALRAVDGSVVWSRETPTLVNRPTIEGNRLYAPLANGRLQALDLRTGEPLWTQHLGGPPTSVLAFPDRVYAGSADQHFYCLDATTGVEQWRFRVGSTLRGAPAAVGGLVYTVALDNLVRAHDRRGHRIWNQSIPYRAFTGPIVAGGLLGVAGPAPELRLFDAATGAPRPAVVFDAPLIAPIVLGHDGRDAVLAAFTVSSEAGWRLVIVDSSYSAPLAPLTALPGETIPLWAPGK